jgi:hypothetical protein
MGPTRIALEFAKRRGIRTICEERAILPGRIMLYDDVNCLDLTDIEGLWTRWRNRPLTPQEVEDIGQVLDDRWRGRAGFFNGLLARQRGFGLRWDAAGAVREVDAQDQQLLDAAPMMATTGLGVASLYACDQIRGVPQAIASDSPRQRGCFDRHVHGPTHLLHGQGFSPLVPALRRSALSAAASAADG